MPRAVPQSRVARIIPSYRGTHPADLAARRLAEVEPLRDAHALWYAVGLMRARCHRMSCSTSS